MSSFQTKAALSTSALTFLTVGVLVTFFPVFLFSLNNVTLDPSAAMMSEIRAPGALILASGLVVIAGLFNPTLERPALMTASALLLSYGLGRLISLPLDGLPPVSLIAATLVEIGVGSWCALILLRTRNRTAHVA